MQPEKKRTPRRLLQPGDGMRNAFGGATIDEAGFFLLEGFGGERVIVKIETARQTPTAIENEGTDNRSCAVARFLEGLGHGTKLRRQWLPRKILDAILKGIRAGEDHGMRGPGQRNLGNCALKNHAIVCQ